MEERRQETDDTRDQGGREDEEPTQHQEPPPPTVTFEDDAVDLGEQGQEAVELSDEHETSDDSKKEGAKE